MKETQERKELRESLQRLADTVNGIKYADEKTRQEALKTLRELIKDSYKDEEIPFNLEALK